MRYSEFKLTVIFPLVPTITAVFESFLKPLITNFAFALLP